MDEQVWPTVSVHIADLGGNRDQVLIGAEEHRAIVDARVVAIPTRKFNDLNMSIEIDKDKVGGMTWAIVVPNYSVHLPGAWAPKLDIFLVKLPPGAEISQAQAEQGDEQEAQKK